MEKINQLIQNWPKGTVYTSAFLKKKGFSKQLINRYKKSGWLEAIGRGAYIPRNVEVDWFGGVYALQQQLNLPVYVGGKTALGLKGQSHFITQELTTAFLYGLSKTEFPGWFLNYKWNVNLHIVHRNLLSGKLENTFSDYFHKDFTIRISSPERATLEMVDQIPGKQTFQEAFLLMENLFTLRPNIVQLLLENCRSVKAKRLFLYMAEKNQHAWFRKISIDKVNLGKGKRSIVKNGKFDKKYQITVPEEF
jgi:hypothetical protein